MDNKKPTREELIDFAIKNELSVEEVLKEDDKIYFMIGGNVVGYTLKEDYNENQQEVYEVDTFEYRDK